MTAFSITDFILPKRKGEVPLVNLANPGVLCRIKISSQHIFLGSEIQENIFKKTVAYVIVNGLVMSLPEYREYVRSK
jgi:hypothetical protein